MPVQCIVSIDVEVNGPIPGPYSMLSLGAVAFGPRGQEVDRWYQKLRRLERSGESAETMTWWRGFPAEYDEATRAPVDAPTAIREFVGWAKTLPGSVVLAASPAAFDGMFVNWYASAIGGFEFDELPWKHRVLDIRTIAADRLKCPYHEAHGYKVRKAYGLGDFAGTKHIAIDDAFNSGQELMALLHGVKKAATKAA